jgi:hypothetical protein
MVSALAINSRLVAASPARFCSWVSKSVAKGLQPRSQRRPTLPDLPPSHRWVVLFQAKMIAIFGGTELSIYQILTKVLLFGRNSAEPVEGLTRNLSSGGSYPGSAESGGPPSVVQRC